MNLLGCRLPEATLASWERRLVFEREPVFVTPAVRRWLPAGAVVLSAAELRENHALAPLDLWDSYGLYRTNRREAEVAFLTPAELWELPEEGRQELMALQAERGRGQIYTEQWLHKVGVSRPGGARDRFEWAGSHRFALRHDAWWTLSPDERRRWLLHFVSEERNSCLSGELSPEEWRRIEERHGPQIRLLAGTFAPESGPNCFATALAGATRSEATALSIAGHWLHPEPFLRGLAERGFELAPMPADLSALPEGAVILFVDAEKRPQHAAYYLGEGLVLNKDAQGWFVPRQIRPVTELMAEWLTEPVRAHIYVRR
ncbi:MAG: hypothetical protein ACOY94_09570 [Bacillota bacterium]